MKNVVSKGKVLTLFTLLFPSIICLALFVGMMINIPHYAAESDTVRGATMWVYFGFTVAVTIIALLTSFWNIYQVLRKEESFKHVRRAIEVSRLSYLLEFFYIIQYVAMLGKVGKTDPIAIVALVLSIISIIGFFISPILKNEKARLGVYAGSGLLYIIFMILLAVLVQTRDYGLTIILLFFYTFSICIAAYTLLHYLKKKN